MITYGFRMYAYPPAPVSLVDAQIQQSTDHKSPDELDVDFDRYMIIYGDGLVPMGPGLREVSGLSALMLGDNRIDDSSGPCRAGCASIGCYRKTQLVGTINFFCDTGEHPEDCMDSDGLVILWYPHSCFANILAILGHNRHLSLALVRNALDGSELAAPMGALLTLPEPIGEEAYAGN